MFLRKTAERFGPLPPYALDLRPSSGLVTVLLLLALALGAAGLTAAYTAPMRGWRAIPTRSWQSPMPKSLTFTMSLASGCKVSQR